MKLSLVLLLTAVAVVAQLRPNPWLPVPVPTTAGLRGLSVVDENTVWISGTNGTVLRTTDSGKTWSALPIPQAETLDFRGLHAFDANTAILMSSGPAEQGQARVYRTSDAGKHWVLVLEEKTAGAFFDAVKFRDSQNGILVGDPVAGRFMLYTTRDGGLTWQRVPPEKLPPALDKEGAFAASNSCLTVQGGDSAWFATGGAATARVFRSTDRGQTWQVAETPIHPANASTGIFSLAFRDALNGIAVGGDYANPTTSPAPNILTTEDGGKTWQPSSPSDPPGLYFSGVALQSETVWAVGSNGVNFMTQEGKVPDGKWHNESNDNFNAIAFSNSGAGSGVGWAVGPKGAVARRRPEAGNPTVPAGVQQLRTP
jgi:photosystem II stability/assembly factor-like uncharacterized protein